MSFAITPEPINLPDWTRPQVQMAPVQTPQFSGLPSSTGAGSGMNWQTGLGMGLQGLNTLGNIWGAWQSNKLAKDQLNFTKMITNANLNNQIKSYNTALEDRSRSRAAVEGQTSAEAQAYVDKNRLTRG